MEQRDIKSLTLEELKGELQAHGEKAFRAGQIYNWMHGKLASGFDEMSNLSKSLRELLKNEYEYTNLERYSDPGWTEHANTCFASLTPM